MEEKEESASPAGKPDSALQATTGEQEVGIPKSQELFKAVVEEPKKEAKKPIFLLNQQEEVKIPQPPQLARTQQQEVHKVQKQETTKTEDENKLTYEELFGDEDKV